MAGRVASDIRQDEVNDLPTPLIAMAYRSRKQGAGVSKVLLWAEVILIDGRPAIAKATIEKRK